MSDEYISYIYMDDVCYFIYYLINLTLRVAPVRKLDAIFTSGGGEEGTSKSKCTVLL